MRSIMLGLVLALSALVPGLSLSSKAEAREVYHGFVKDTYYLARGGTPATFKQVAANPLKVFRSQLAYETLRAHVGNYLGKYLNDEDFRALLLSDQVRLTPCVGRIDTSGVSDSGRFGWHKRACYRNEMLIELRLSDGRWVIVASQGCYNPVRGQIPKALAVRYEPPPPPMVYRPQEQSTIVWQSPGMQVSGSVHAFGCTSCCNQQQIIVTPSISIPGSVNQTTTFGN